MTTAQEMSHVTQNKQYDVAIVGAGPAGLQAALVLARTRKAMIVFDSPEPPRNSASHGVHNFLGLDGLLPAQIREQAWQQINVYGSAELCVERIVDVQRSADGLFALRGENGTTIAARHVMLAVGYRDIYPDIPGFQDCWGHTIIPCPFCDGYENRDRVWGIVPASELALEHLPTMAKNWTADVKVFLPNHFRLSTSRRETFAAQNILVYQGEISAIHHSGSSVEAVTLDTGERVEVGTLIWHPQEVPAPLTQQAIETFGLELDENKHIKTDANHQTTIEGLWAVGDIKGWASALGAAFAAGQAAAAIVREWYK